MLGVTRSESHRRVRLASLATLAAIAALAATSTTDAGTRAGVTCRFDIATHRLTVMFHNDDANGGIVRDGDDLVVEYYEAPIGCAGTQDPTRFNTERVRVRTRARSVDDLSFLLSLRGGPMAPGFSDEGDGSSEIEFSVSFSAGSANPNQVPIYGRRVPDRIVLGDLAHRKGVNLNAAEDVDDPDVTIRGGIPLVLGFGGADVISARGGGGFIGPYPWAVGAFGQRGDDLVTGGPNRDYLIGGRGHDTIEGGRGGDFLLARDNTRDLVNCGRGSDIAKVDRMDRLRRCEDARTKGRSPLTSSGKRRESAAVASLRQPEKLRPAAPRGRGGAP